MYGYKLKSVDDPIIFAANRSLLLGGSLLTPDASIINIFPFLACIPPWLSGPMTSRKAAAEADELLRFAQGSLMDCAKAVFLLRTLHELRSDKNRYRKTGPLSPLSLQVSWQNTVHPNLAKGRKRRCRMSRSPPTPVCLLPYFVDISEIKSARPYRGH